MKQLLIIYSNSYKVDSLQFGGGGEALTRTSIGSLKCSHMVLRYLSAFYFKPAQIGFETHGSINK